MRGDKREDLYRSAFSSYQAAQYEEAASRFSQLLMQNPFEEKYWRGFAASQQMGKRYEEALSAWALVALLAPNDPSPHLHAAECYFGMGDKGEGLKALKVAKEFAPGFPNTDVIQEKIEALYRFWFKRPLA